MQDDDETKLRIDPDGHGWLHDDQRLIPKQTRRRLAAIGVTLAAVGAALAAVGCALGLG